MRHDKENKAGRERPAERRHTPRRHSGAKSITGIAGEWIQLSHEWLNTDNIAFVEELSETMLAVHMLKDRADRQKLPVVNEKPWRRKTRKLIIIGEDAKTLRKWLRSRSVLLILPKRRDPDEF